LENYLDAAGVDKCGDLVEKMADLSLATSPAAPKATPTTPKRTSEKFLTGYELFITHFKGL
jgi:hypothetical protein